MAAVAARMLPIWTGMPRVNGLDWPVGFQIA